MKKSDQNITLVKKISLESCLRREKEIDCKAITSSLSPRTLEIDTQNEKKGSFQASRKIPHFTDVANAGKDGKENDRDGKYRRDEDDDRDGKEFGKDRRDGRDIRELIGRDGRDFKQRKEYGRDGKELKDTFSMQGRDLKDGRADGKDGREYGREDANSTLNLPDTLDISRNSQIQDGFFKKGRRKPQKVNVMGSTAELHDIKTKLVKTAMKKVAKSKESSDEEVDEEWKTEIYTSVRKSLYGGLGPIFALNAGIRPLDFDHAGEQLSQKSSSTDDTSEEGKSKDSNDAKNKSGIGSPFGRSGSRLRDTLRTRDRQFSLGPGRDRGLSFGKSNDRDDFGEEDGMYGNRGGGGRYDFGGEDGMHGNRGGGGKYDYGGDDDLIDGKRRKDGNRGGRKNGKGNKNGRMFDFASMISYDDNELEDDILHEDSNKRYSSRLSGGIRSENDRTSKKLSPAFVDNFSKDENEEVTDFLAALRKRRKSENSFERRMDYAKLTNQAFDNVSTNATKRYAWQSGVMDKFNDGAFEWAVYIDEIRARATNMTNINKEVWFRFSLPMDLRSLKTMTVEEYLTKYCFITEEHEVLFDSIYVRYHVKLSSSKSYILGSSIFDTINEIFIEPVSKEEYEVVWQHLGIEADEQISQQFFKGISALCERVIYRNKTSFACMMQEHSSPGYLEQADLYALDHKLNGVEVNPAIHKILKLL